MDRCRVRNAALEETDLAGQNAPTLRPWPVAGTPRLAGTSSFRLAVGSWSGNYRCVPRCVLSIKGSSVPSRDSGATTSGSGATRMLTLHRQECETRSRDR